MEEPTHQAERRADMISLAEFRAHIYAEIDAIKVGQAKQDEKIDRLLGMDEKVTELLGILRASKIGASFISWLAKLLVAWITVYAFFRYGGKL